MNIVVDPDPGSCAFLTTGFESWIREKCFPDLESWIPDPHFVELRFWVKNTLILSQLVQLLFFTCSEIKKILVL